MTTSQPLAGPTCRKASLMRRRARFRDTARAGPDDRIRNPSRDGDPSSPASSRTRKCSQLPVLPQVWTRRHSSALLSERNPMGTTGRFRRRAGRDPWRVAPSGSPAPRESSYGRENRACAFGVGYWADRSALSLGQVRFRRATDLARRLIAKYAVASRSAGAVYPSCVFARQGLHAKSLCMNSPSPLDAPYWPLRTMSLRSRGRCDSDGKGTVVLPPGSGRSSDEQNDPFSTFSTPVDMSVDHQGHRSAPLSLSCSFCCEPRHCVTRR